ncbi:MAG TPA: hypothetical protein GXX30_10275 [Firmicutes bacterium]|nr:hypothetical protein [Candidatus Fermentithermobacillaceae bacterium]
MSGAVDPFRWYQTFRRVIRRVRFADALREAAMEERLQAWTEHLTNAVVETCTDLGLMAVARGHLAEVLPVPKQEYLAIDVMAFSRSDRPGWRRPVAAFELENRMDLEAISYSVWKVSVVRCFFGGVFCYRQQREGIKDLLVDLTREVMAKMHPPGEQDEAKILLVVGTRAEAEDFPDGFFKPYLWDSAVGQFRPLW